MAPIADLALVLCSVSALLYSVIFIIINLYFIDQNIKFLTNLIPWYNLYAWEFWTLIHQGRFHCNSLKVLRVVTKDKKFFSKLELLIIGFLSLFPLRLKSDCLLYARVLHPDLWRQGLWQISSILILSHPALISPLYQREYGARNLLTFVEILLNLTI